MSNDKGHNFYKVVSFSEYQRGKKDMVIPDELTGEFYTLRQQVNEFNRRLGNFAIDTLVSIENVELSGHYFKIEFLYADIVDTGLMREKGISNVLFARANGLMFHKHVRRTVVRRREVAQMEESGYMMDVEFDVGSLVPTESARRPRAYSLA